MSLFDFKQLLVDTGIIVHCAHETMICMYHYALCSDNDKSCVGTCDKPALNRMVLVSLVCMMVVSASQSWSMVKWQ